MSGSGASTPILFYNRDHFKAAGFDKPGATWQELEPQLDAIKAKGVSKCAMVLPGDYEWSFLENYSAVNDLPYATKRNGMDGLDTSFVFNKGKLVGQVERMKRLVTSNVMQIAGQGLFPSRSRPGDHVTPRQYGRLLDDWVALIGLDPALYGTHSLRRTKVALIYKRTGNLRACQLLLGHSKLESTVRYLGIEVDDALIMSEQTDL
jgi:hypothetical protein